MTVVTLSGKWFILEFTSAPLPRQSFRKMVTGFPQIYIFIPPALPLVSEPVVDVNNANRMAADAGMALFLNPAFFHCCEHLFHANFETDGSPRSAGIYRFLFILEAMRLVLPFFLLSCVSLS
jgi:hypothetical protein